MTEITVQKFLTPQQLAERWGGAITVETLNNWRHLGRGCPFKKIGGRVVYQLEDVERFEENNFKTQKKDSNDQQKNL